MSLITHSEIVAALEAIRSTNDGAGALKIGRNSIRSDQGNSHQDGGEMGRRHAVQTCVCIYTSYNVMRVTATFSAP